MFLFVIIVLLNMLALALNDLLCLLGHSVQLHIFGPLFEVSDFQGKTFVLVLHMLKSSLGLVDVNHLLDFLVTSILNLAVLPDDHLLVNKNRILVVRRDRGLGHFYLSLLQVDDYLKVILHLLQTLPELLGPGRGSTFLLLQRLRFSLQVR